MYSLNVPLPGEVSALAGSLALELPDARPRERGAHTLVAKRLGRGDRASFHELAARTREALAGQPPFETRVTRIDLFETAATGPSPVVYLAVQSPGLVSLHDELCEEFEPVEGVEGPDYVPHVTIARGGSLQACRRLANRDVSPIEWTVPELVFYDAERGERASRVSLPA